MVFGRFLKGTSFIYTLALTVLFSLHTQSIHAQEVSVLGVSNVDGDVDAAEYLNEALRAEAKKISGWKVSKNPATIDQMILAFDCDRPTARCLSEIAPGIGADILIFGSLERAVSDNVFIVKLSRFDADKKSVTKSVDENVLSSQLSSSNVNKIAKKLVGLVAGTIATGEILVISNPNSTVTLDGNYLGVTNSDGRLLVRDVEVGRQELKITDSNGAVSTQKVQVSPGETTNIRPDANASQESEEDSGGGIDWRIPTSLVGGAVGIGLLSLGVFSMAQVGDYASQESEIISNFNNSGKDFAMLRSNAGNYSDFQQVFLVDGNENATDVCANAKGSINGNADGADARQAACDDLEKHSTFQYVFSIAGIATLALSTALLIWALTDDGESEGDVAWMVAPAISDSYTGLAGTLVF